MRLILIDIIENESFDFYSLLVVFPVEVKEIKSVVERYMTRKKVPISLMGLFQTFSNYLRSLRNINICFTFMVEKRRKIIEKFGTNVYKKVKWYIVKTITIILQKEKPNNDKRRKKEKARLKNLRERLWVMTFPT